MRAPGTKRGGIRAARDDTIGSDINDDAADASPRAPDTVNPTHRRRLLARSFALLAALGAPWSAPRIALARPRRTAAAAGPGHYDSRRDVLRFIDVLVESDGFSRAKLVRAFREARYRAAIVEAMDRPLVTPPKWYEYAPRFLDPGRIGGGIEFWRANETTLSRAEDQFGVPAEIVVAILGVETYWGRNTGSYRVLDALSTLAFDYPRRAAYFRGQLREFLLFVREQGLSAQAPMGSFAGAMGLPQFMPGNVRHYALDYDGDGRIDLWTCAADSIGSVANYLARHDWLRGQPVWSRAIVAESAWSGAMARLDGGISERRPLEAWNAEGVGAERMPVPMAPQPVGLLMLEEDPAAAAPGEASPAGEPVSLWIAFPNFYAITRYNRSRLYAAAVTRLAEELRVAQDALPR